MILKLFVTSDIHSYYKPLKKALDDAGFDASNENHWLIVCGDTFDRGPDSKEVLKFIMSLERKVLVRGNHDDLLEQCCEREYFLSHDNSNGTVRTITDLGKVDSSTTFEECCNNTYNRLAAYRDSLVNYFETKNYIFVHGWIPSTDEYGQLWFKNKQGTFHRYYDDWRNASLNQWYKARWVNGMDSAMEGVIEPNKTIVCGHWHCSYGHHIASKGAISEFSEDAKWEPYIAEGIIAIDRCVAHTGELNVLVLEDDFIEDK